MNHYLTANTIRELREKRGLTQAELAEKLFVSDKAVSKWETGKGLPDITLLEPLAKELGVSLPELLTGEQIINRNRAANMLRTKLYACPVCGNILHATGDILVSCCGVVLPPLEAEEADETHDVSVEPVEDELFVSARHPMTKDHYLSFVAVATDERVTVIKLYPEGEAQTRLRCRGGGMLYWYCNKHGLFRKKL